MQLVVQNKCCDCVFKSLSQTKHTHTQMCNPAGRRAAKAVEAYVHRTTLIEVENQSSEGRAGGGGSTPHSLPTAGVSIATVLSLSLPLSGRSLLASVAGWLC